MHFFFLTLNVNLDLLLTIQDWTSVNTLFRDSLSSGTDLPILYSVDLSANRADDADFGASL